MTYQYQAVKRLFLLMSLLALSACGGGSSSIDEPVLQPAPAPPTTVVINGGITKGVLVGATINAYPLAVNGSIDYNTLVASAVTDSNGLFNLTLPTSRSYLHLESSGGTFVDETDQNPDPAQRRKITFGSREGLKGVLPPSVNTIAMTIITQSLYEKTLREFSNDFYTVFEQNVVNFTMGLGFNTLSTLAADPNNPDPSSSQSSRPSPPPSCGLGSRGFWVRSASSRSSP